MKKQTIMGLAVIAALGLGACNETKTSSSTSSTASCCEQKCDNCKEVLYSGILPAADAQGTVYTLVLDYDDDNNYTNGDYTLVENSLTGDEEAVSGLKDAATSYSEGDFVKASKDVDGTKVEYIRLTPDAKYSTEGSLYFVVNADGSLTMVNEDLQLPEHPELYTLTVK